MLSFRLAVAAIALAAVAPATASPITTLYSTGVDNAGIATTGNGVDLHWGLLPEAGAYTGGANGVFPIGPWLAETATSRWLTPSSNAAQSYDPVSDGIYTYTTTFDLTGFKTASAALRGRFASDNTVDSITLNGVTITGSGGSFTSWNNFSSAGGTFVAGVNRLTFTVRNFASGSGNPTGLRVEVAGTAGAIPEAATWTMMVAGFGMIGFAARRRVRTIAA